MDEPERRESNLLLFPSRVRVHYQPVGVVGIVVPWNFPIYLSVSPLVAALAAGNKVMIKLSEFTPATNNILTKIIEPLRDHVSVVQGDGEVGAAFSSLPFDHLLFTGSTRVGRMVAKSAAQNLTPITLELGGKSPVLIAPDASVDSAVQAVLTGKALNSGQICVAPDYVFLAEGKQQEFVDSFKKQFLDIYDSGDQENKLTHIINESHQQRLQSYLDDAREKGAQIHAVRDFDSKKKASAFYPHLLTNVNEQMQVMKEEIFGSLLPILTYKKIEEAIQFINNRPRPLALYLMSNDQSVADHVLKQTHSGGVCINDTLVHVGAEDAPFGGIGESGIGHYHGREGFLTFSKAKTVLKSYSWIPKNKIFLKYRDWVFKALRKLLLR